MSPTQAEEGSQKIVPSSGPLAGQAVYAHSYALLVGVNRYPHLPPGLWLHYADADALALRDVLVRSYGFPARNVQVLTDAQATKQNIEDALASFADQTRIGLDDRILIFFSGHGQTVPLSGGGEMGFLIPSDADVDLTHPDNSAPYLKTCVPMEDIWSYLEASPAKHVLLLADACYSGLFAQSREIAITPELLSVLAHRPARQVIAAGRKQDSALEVSNVGHGAFTSQLLRELNERADKPNNIFTARQLFTALQEDVLAMTKGQQMPQMGDHETEGQFFFIAAAHQSKSHNASALTKAAAPTPAVPISDFHSVAGTTIQSTTNEFPKPGQQSSSTTSHALVYLSSEADSLTRVFVVGLQDDALHYGSINADQMTLGLIRSALAHGVVADNLLFPAIINSGQSERTHRYAQMVALLAASVTDHESCLSEAQEHIISIHPNFHGGTALMWAVYMGNTEMVQALLSAGWNADAQNQTGQTALLTAVEEAQTAMVSFLLTHGASPNLQNVQGATALMVAAGGEDAGMVKLLLDHNADYTICDHRGHTALQMARMHTNNDAVLALLTSAGETK